MGTDIHAVWQAKVDNGWQDIESAWEQNRHYALFAWLGNVRNGFGVAGVPTHKPIEPLSDGRGIPKDFEIKDQEHNGEWLGDHSHTWLNIDEILAAEPPSGDFDYFLDEVKRLKELHGDVRLVLGFDS